MNTEQKYPAEIVEAVSAAILANFNAPDERHSSWWINPDVAAVAALDALGLFVKEQWSNTDLDWMPVLGYQSEFGVGGPPRGFKANRRRFDLHAQTPWVEVVSDGE